MFKKYSPLVLASLLGIGAFALPASTASAAALPYVQQNAAQTIDADTALLQEVNHGREGRRDRWRGYNRWGGYGHWRGHRHWRHRNRGFGHFGFYAAPLIIGGGYGYSRYGYGGGSHGEWCANRYNSYNWRRNTWVAYSGRVYQCRSPFRYY